MSVKNPGRNASYVDYDVGNTVDEPQETPESEGLLLFVREVLTLLLSWSLW